MNNKNSVVMKVVIRGTRDPIPSQEHKQSLCQTILCSIFCILVKNNSKIGVPGWHSG